VSYEEDDLHLTFLCGHDHLNFTSVCLKAKGRSKPSIYTLSTHGYHDSLKQM